MSESMVREKQRGECEVLCRLLSPTEGKITYNGKIFFLWTESIESFSGICPEFGYSDFTVLRYIFCISVQLKVYVLRKRRKEQSF